MEHDPQPLGDVETQFVTIADGAALELESGERLGPITVAYETYGELNEDRSNAILIEHALSGDAHAAGTHHGKAPGWWDDMIGPGKAFDTDKYFVIASNVLGGCKGTTGPSSVNPATGKPYALGFPIFSINDMVECQKYLVDHLGIDQLLCVAGGSMGGMQVLSWMARYPERLKGAIPIATAMKHSPQQIAFNEVGRQSIMADSAWNDGNFYDGEPPAKGLSLARMIGHITYMSDVSMERKFGRAKREDEDAASIFKFTADWEVQGYLRYHGDNFVRRFDANSYLYLTEAMDHFDASAGRPFSQKLFGRELKVLVIAFESDWLYPAHQSKEIVKACKHAHIGVSYCEIPSTYGHDAFLLETVEETKLISAFLRRLSRT